MTLKRQQFNDQRHADEQAVQVKANESTKFLLQWIVGGLFTVVLALAGVWGTGVMKAADTASVRLSTLETTNAAQEERLTDIRDRLTRIEDLLTQDLNVHHASPSRSSKKD